VNFTPQPGVLMRTPDFPKVSIAGCGG